MLKKKILMVIGTRPEAIKMAPLVHELKKSKLFDLDVCVTAQHRSMLDQVLELFDIHPDYDLDVMQEGQKLEELTGRIISSVSDVIKKSDYEMILVHGDTTTTFGSALAAYYNKIKIGHVEAGLRTHDIYSPWPEEANRKLVAALSSFHFAPTVEAKNNLISENVDPNKIIVTGNTVIDSLKMITARLRDDFQLEKEVKKEFSDIDFQKKILLVTGHRRENFGEGFNNICIALKKLAEHYQDLEIVYPVHLNPNVRNPVFKNLSEAKNIKLIEPLEYTNFAYLLLNSHIVLTDSGGIQEEAPFLGKPVLVMRDTTERPEAVKAGTVKLVGTDVDRIFENVTKLLEDNQEYFLMSRASNPYGDGNSSKVISSYLEQNL